MSRKFPLFCLPFILAGALPAAAQDAPSCSGQPALWLGGLAEESDVSTAGRMLSLSMSTTDATSPYAMIRVTGAMQPLRIEAMSDGDPALRLETPDGDLLAENDDAVGLNARIEQTVGPGDYCIRLLAVGQPRITATVAVTTPDLPPLLTGPVDTTIAPCLPDTPARDLDGPLPRQATTGGAVEYLRFTLDQPAPVTLRATSGDLDPNMILFDDQGNQVAANDDADGLNARLDFPSGLVGAHCLGVAPISAGEGRIEVSLAALDRDAYLRDAHRRGELPPPLDGTVPMQRIDIAATPETVVLHDGTAQWLVLTLDRETVLIVTAHGSLVGVDSKLALFGPSGGLVAQDDDGSGTVDARIGPVVLAPGDYRLAVTDVNRPDQAGAPIRPVGLVFERFQRVE